MLCVVGCFLTENGVGLLAALLLTMKGVMMKVVTRLESGTELCSQSSTAN